MKLRTIFDYRDYRRYLENYLESRPSKGHGEKSKIAAALRCHNAYFSQVLSGKAELSLEQAHLLSQYLGFNTAETDQLLLLVQLARAGTDGYKKHIIKKLDAIEHDRSVLQKRIQFKQTLSTENRGTYFSAWYYSVIHLMVATMKGFQASEQIEKALGLPAKTVREVLQFLETTGLLQRGNAGYEPGLVDIHLSSEDKMIVPHHTHWRMRAIHSLDNRGPEDLHYSTAFTLSEDDFKEVREILIQTLEKTREKIAKTKPEKVAVLTMDWFELWR